MENKEDKIWVVIEYTREVRYSRQVHISKEDFEELNALEDDEYHEIDPQAQKILQYCDADYIQDEGDYLNNVNIYKIS